MPDDSTTEARQLAETARAAIDAAGGLCNANTLAQEWGLSRTRLSQFVNAPGFPAPVGTLGGRPIWLRCEVDAWRERRG